MVDDTIDQWKKWLEVCIPAAGVTLNTWIA